MTNEKAMDLLENLIGMVDDNQENDYDEALKMGIKALEKQTKPYERFEQCLCGCNRREKWSGVDNGKNFVKYVCRNCGLSVIGKNGADAKRKWNKYMRCGR